MAQAAATLYMVGLIWFVQLVHYPLFGLVGGDFVAYERAHVDRTGWVVIPPMLTEAATVVWGVVWALPGVVVWEAWLGAGVLAGVWGSTFALQVPRHGRLAQGFDAATHRGLVGTNWLRTVGWTARGALVLVWVGRGVAA